MSETIKDQINSQGGFHEGSTTDAHDIDHGIVPDRTIGDGEVPDFNQAAATQDANGTAAQHGELHTGTGSKSPSPFWLFRDHAWRKGVNQSTGEVFWTLNPLADVVATVISYCPGIVEDAYKGLTEEDKAAACAFGRTLRDLCVEGEAIDSWLERTATYAFARDAAKNAASAVKWTTAQYEASARKDEQRAIEHGERASKAGRTAAMLRLALITADATIEINYKSGAWDLYKQDAFRQQKLYMNPDEQAVFDNAQTESLTAPGFKLRAS